MNDIKILPCCDNCKWGEGAYEGEVECRCPTSLAKAKEIEEYNDSESFANRKRIDWIYDCNGNVVKYSYLSSQDYICSWGSNQCVHWELLGERK